MKSVKNLSLCFNLYKTVLPLNSWCSAGFCCNLLTILSVDYLLTRNMYTC